jgi:hypothetical protein
MYRLKNYCEVLHVLNNRNFIFFTSVKKSSLIELTDWAEHNLNADNLFKNCVISTANSHCSGVANL